MLRGPPLAGVIGTDPELRAVRSFDKRVRVLLAFLARDHLSRGGVSAISVGSV